MMIIMMMIRMMIMMTILMMIMMTMVMMIMLSIMMPAAPRRHAWYYEMPFIAGCSPGHPLASWLAGWLAGEGGGLRHFLRRTSGPFGAAGASSGRAGI